MSAKHPVTVVRSGNGLWINIPSRIRKEFHIMKGDSLEIIAFNDKLIIRLDKIVHTAESLGFKKRQALPVDAQPDKGTRSSKGMGAT